MRNQSLYTGNDIINIFRNAGVLPMNDDWLGIGDPFGLKPNQYPTHEQLERQAMENARLIATTSRQINDNIHNAFMTDEEKRRRKACPNKPLTQHPSRYLTGLDGSPCEKLEPKWQDK